MLITFLQPHAALATAGSPGAFGSSSQFPPIRRLGHDSRPYIRRPFLFDCSTYRHESTRAAGPSVPYVCTRPYRAPELFYGSECYRGEPDGARARVRVRGCLFSPVHPSFRPCRGPCARLDARSAPLRARTMLPPLLRSVVPRLLALRHLAAWQHVSKSHVGRPCSTILACIDLRAPQFATPDLLWASRLLRTNLSLQRRVGASPPPHGARCRCTLHHRCGEQLFDAERVDGHQVLCNKDEKGAKSAAQLHLLHSCLGTPTEQAGFCCARSCLLHFSHQLVVVICALVLTLQRTGHCRHEPCATH